MKKILVVDDEPAVCHALKKFLTKKGYEVDTVLSGKEAIKKVKKKRPHIVLLDIRMPKMDGIETLKKIREIDEKIGIIMITAVREVEIGKTCMELGAYAYITKPFDLVYLKTILTLKLHSLEKGAKGAAMANKLRILVVDDEQATRKLFAHFLEPKRYKVTTVKDGPSAIEAVKKNAYDLIFLDVVLPGMDGIEVVSQLKKIAETPVIAMMTGFLVRDKLEEAHKLGANECLQKPFDITEIMKVIEKVAKKKEEADE